MSDISELFEDPYAALEDNDARPDDLETKDLAAVIRLSVDREAAEAAAEKPQPAAVVAFPQKRVRMIQHHTFNGKPLIPGVEYTLPVTEANRLIGARYASEA